MNRKDIETFVEIQNRLHTYSKNVLTTLGKDYPECGISDIARVIICNSPIRVIHVCYPYIFPSSTLRQKTWKVSARLTLRR